MRWGTLSTTLLLAACTAGGPDQHRTATQQPLTPQQLRIDRMELASDGVPHFVRGALGRARGPIASVGDASALDLVMPAIATTFRVPAHELFATRVQRDDLGMTHVRYEQRKQGLRVVGGDLVVHLAANGDVRSVNSTARDGAGLPITPTLSADDAARRATAATANGASDAGATELVYVIATRDGAMHLAWQIEVTGRAALVRDLVYVSAVDGRVVDRRPQVQSAKNRKARASRGSPRSSASKKIS